MGTFKTILAKSYLKILGDISYVTIFGTENDELTTRLCFELLGSKQRVGEVGFTSVDPSDLEKLLFRIKRNCRVVVMNIDISIPEKIDEVLKLIRPQTVVLTHLSSQQENQDIDSTAGALKKFIGKLRKNGQVIVNYEDQNLRNLCRDLGVETIYFGREHENCHVWISSEKIEDFQTVFEINYGVEKVEVRSSLLGIHQIYPQLAAATLGIVHGVHLTTIKNILERTIPLPSHMQVFSGWNGSTVIDDTYGVSVDGLKSAIATLDQVSARRRIAVISGVEGLGRDSEKIHNDLARKIYKQRLDYVFTVGRDGKLIVDELVKLGMGTERLESDLQNPQIVSKLIKILGKGDVVLIKGDKRFRLDEIVKRLIKIR